jgi:BRCA1-associated protein
MDANVTGLLTIQCTHTFHCSCISKWGDQSCPVCRYTVKEDASDQSVCARCGTLSDLWICLLCGNIGCGRYKSGHAQQHYCETNHVYFDKIHFRYALELETQRVWDYIGVFFKKSLIGCRMDMCID